MDWIKRKRDEEIAKDRAAKRAAWNALQKHTPELVPLVRQFAGRFGIAGVSCAGNTWGDVDAEDVEWAQ